MKRKILNILRIGLIVLSLLFLTLGIKDKQVKGVFIKASNI